MKDLVTNTTAAATMTSREIATLAGKRHDHVLRDIDNLLETLSPELGNGFKTSTYVSGDPPREYRQFDLDRDASLCLIAGYDANTRMKIIKRWQALEAGTATPAHQVDTVRPREIREAFSSFLSIAKMIGLKGNQAALAADTGTRNFTGRSALALIDKTHLAADTRGQTYTPTELGKMMDPPVSAVKLNRLIEKAGLQARDIRGGWVPDDEASDLCEWLDTGKRHSDGVPVKQLKWFAGVIERLSADAA